MSDTGLTAQCGDSQRRLLVNGQRDLREPLSHRIVGYGGQIDHGIDTLEMPGSKITGIQKPLRVQHPFRQLISGQTLCKPSRVQADKLCIWPTLT